MRVCVQGLWHLGCVTAACVAEHFQTTACDSDLQVIERLKEGHPPIFEPGLSERIAAAMAAQRLSFTTDLAAAVRNADAVWVTLDTPVDDQDVADVDFVEREIAKAFPYLSDRTIVLISSQVPVGFTARLEARFNSAFPRRRVGFAYSPENLRLGRAIQSFCKPERIVIGTRSEETQRQLEPLLRPFCERLEWMSVESAEMTKHALNAFLATSVAYANEIAVICEQVGADAKQVERGLKSDARIGSGAYLGPGGPFAGGTLARDLGFLVRIGDGHGVPTHLLSGVRQSNDEHKHWLERKVLELVGSLKGRTLAVLGLTYKPETDTLRRSGSMEFCDWANRQGARVQAFDPAIRQLPAESAIQLCSSVELALSGADALVIGTEWKQFKEISADQVVAKMRAPIVVDSTRFLFSQMGTHPRVRYVTVGLQARDR
jgi:UDPglucose 6-dehydrogenase